MELTSNVMRFALATYFMKRSSGTHLFQPPNTSTLLLQEPRDASFDEELNPEFTDFILTSVSSLSQFMVEERLQDWSNGVTELRRFVVTNGLAASLVAVLVNLLKEQEQHAECIVQVVEHMCFEKGKPSEVCDKFVECLLVAKDNCCQNNDTEVETWLTEAIDSITYGLRQYQEQNKEPQDETSRLTVSEWKV